MERSSGYTQVLQAVGEHVERYIGKVDFVLRERKSPAFPVDLNIVLATEHRPFHTVVTGGMSELPMTLPTELADGRFAELMLCLPPDWPLDQDSFCDENVWWPFRLLKGIARFPHNNKTWLYEGHTIINQEEVPFAPQTKLSSVILVPPTTVSDEGLVFRLNKSDKGRLWALIPLYHEELELKLGLGYRALEDLLGQYDITELLNPQRKNMVFELMDKRNFKMDS